MKKFDNIYKLFDNGQITLCECGYLMMNIIDGRVTLNSFYNKHLNKYLFIIDRKYKTCLVMMQNKYVANQNTISCEDIKNYRDIYNNGERGVILV